MNTLSTRITTPGPTRAAGRLLLLLLSMALAACGDDPVAPSPCGSLPQVTLNAGETANVSACFEDLNGDMLTYSVSTSNSSVARASASGPRITVEAVSPGNATVTVTAQDPGGLQGQQSFPVMVPNRPPVARGSIPTADVVAGRTHTVDASRYFTEPDGQALNYSAVSSDPSVVTVSVAGATVTVTAVGKGTANVTVTATDPGGLTATQTFQATVPNQPPRPVGTIPARTIQVGDPATLDVSQYFDDPDGDALTYSVTSSNSRVATASVAGANLTVTAVAKGTADVTVTATDPDRLSATQTFRVTVPNRPPQRRGTIPAQTITEGRTATVNLSSYFTDPDGDALTMTASSSNTGVARTSVSGRTLTVTAVTPGAASVTVTARDSEGASVQQGFGITVTRANRAPQRQGTIPAQTITEGQTGTVNASSYFTDPDGDALTYSASTSNTGVARVSVAGSVVTMSAVRVGSATVTVTARDPGGLTATQSVSVTVSRANRAPQRQGTIPAQTITEGQTGTVNASSYFTDPDGDALTYSASTSNTGVARVSVAGSVVTISAVRVGSATVTVTARDPGGLTATQSASVTVSRANRVPQRQGTIPAQTIREGQTATVNAASYFTDPDGDPLTYSASSSNTGVAQVSVSVSVVTVSAVAVGSATVTVTARDPGGLTATQSVPVTVASSLDRDALNTLYNSLGGSSWTRRDNWGTNAPLNAWYGVTADAAGRVTRLSLDSNNLTGEIPSELGSLTSLTRLSLSNNNLTGSIPPQLGNLENLTELSLDSNNLTGEIPFQLGDVIGCEIFRLHDNNLTGEIPSQLRNLTNLTELSLGGNNLTGEIPSELGGLASLGDLNLSSNRLTGELPASFLSLTLHRFLWDNNQGLCAPATPAFRTWLGGISDHRPGPFCVSNRAPQPVGSIPALELDSDDAATINVSPYFSDPDGDVLTYSASSSNTGVARASVSGVDVAVSAVGVGAATVTVTARDPGGLSATQTVGVTVRASGAPNLVFSSVSPRTATVTPGDTVDVDIVIRNDGNAGAAATNLRFLQSDDATITRRDRELGSPSSLPALAASQQVRVDWGVIIPSNFTPQTVYVGWCVDDVPGESNTQDNCSPSVQITVTAAGGVTRLTFHSASDSDPAWSADYLIAFSSRRNGNDEIYVMDADGSNLVQLTNNSATNWFPAWSPDGGRIAFSSRGDIYTMDGDGSNVARLTSHSATDWFPAWSPDRGRIAFTSWRDGNGEIYMMDADGSNVVRLTNHSAEYEYREPAWSPDGGRIAFQSYDPGNDGNDEIYVMNADGSNVVQLTNHSANDWQPAWSPDGRRIAFVSDRTGLADIYVMDADGSNAVRLTNHPAGDLSPTWGPDGRQIAFESWRAGNADIYVMDVPASRAGQQQMAEPPRLRSVVTISEPRRR